MIEIRWHGRGGQGAFTAARLLGQSVSIGGGKYASAFPSFGPERRGAPVLAFTRIDKEPISDRSDITTCDYAVVLDETLFGAPVKQGLKPGAIVVVNTTKSEEEFEIPDCKVIAVDGTGLALEILKRPITNVPMLGALAAASGVADLDSMLDAIDAQLPEKVRAKNKELLKVTYEKVKEGMK